MSSRSTSRLADNRATVSARLLAIARSSFAGGGRASSRQSKRHHLSRRPRSEQDPSPHSATETATALIRVGVLGISNVGEIFEIDTFYDVLGVSHNADNREIKIAFRKLAKRWHPDFNAGDEEAERRFKKVCRAYKVLRDSKRRAAYDLHVEEM